jgi:hypothetical protein
MFWLCMMNGACGHTYGANGIWQVNRKEQPHGPSPHHAPGVGYGKIPWDEAMHLPASTHVAIGKKLFEKYDWQKFVPHPEWVSYADDATTKPAYGPFASGSEKVRIIYVPELHSIRVTNLSPAAHYRAQILNPASGKTSPIDNIKLDEKQSLTVRPPAQADAEDWVLIVESQ